MKINNNYIHENEIISNNEFYLQLNDLFLKFLDDFPDYIESNEEFTNGDFLYKDNEELIKQYLSKYIYFNKLLDYDYYNELLSKIFNLSDLPRNLISENEIDLLRLMFGDEKNDVSVILGKVGWGKTTLVKYVLKFLLKYKKKECKFIPIHLDFNLYVNKLNSENDRVKSVKLLYKLLRKKVLKINSNTLHVDNENYWTFLKSLEDFSEYKQEEATLLKIYKEDKIEYFKLRSKLLKKNNAILYSLKYLKQEYNSKIIIFIDNIDPVNDIPTQAILVELYKIVKVYKIKAIVSFRPNTYSEIENKKEGVFDTFTPKSITLCKPRAKYIFKSKLKYLKKNEKDGKLQILFGNRILKSESTFELLESYLILLKNKHVSNFLDNICSGNLRVWSKTLKIFFSSGYLKEHRLYSNYLKYKLPKEEYKEYYNPEWIAFSSIITSNHTMFFPSYEGDRRKDLIINLFNNKTFSFNTSIIRLNILQFFNHEASEINTLKRIYMEVFKCYSEQEDIEYSINYAVRILINAGLISSNRVYKVDADESINYIRDLKIEESGQYYLSVLIVHLDYLKFMKDDVHMPEEYLDEIYGSKKSRSNKRTFLDIIKFLSFLTKTEFELIDELDIKSLKLYIKYFSIGSEFILFTSFILNRLSKLPLYKNELSSSKKINKEVLFLKKYINDCKNKIQNKL